MTTTAVNVSLPTLLDVMKRTDPNGAPAQIVEILNARNAFLQDAVFTEANMETGHLISMRTGLPSVGWRRLNEGVTPGKSRVNQFTETCAILSAISKCDVDLAEMAAGGPAAFRLSESVAFLEAMSQQMESAFAYAALASDPEQINGLIPRFASTADTGGSQVIKCDSDASGSVQTSVLLVGWGPKAVHGIYPKGSKAGGIVHNDLGAVLTKDAGGTNEFRAYVDTYDWKVGVAVENYRYAARVCNIDAAKLAAGTSPLIEAMITAYHQTENAGVRQAWYCNRAVGTALHLAALNKVNNSTLSIDKDLASGKPVTSFLGIPIRITDAILSTEAVVS